MVFDLIIYLLIQQESYLVGDALREPYLSRLDFAKSVFDAGEHNPAKCLFH